MQTHTRVEFDDRARGRLVIAELHADGIRYFDQEFGQVRWLPCPETPELREKAAARFAQNVVWS